MDIGLFTTGHFFLEPIETTGISIELSEHTCQTAES
jgi:hypothetical protein